MKRSKPFYILGLLIIAIIMVIGSVFLFSGATKESRDKAEKDFIESVLDGFDWETFPWETFPFDSFKNFPWESLPWDKIPWEDIPETFPWDKIPPDAVPWDQIPENFPWESYPWENLPENFWDEFPFDKLPEDFDWGNIPFDKLPETFDWNKFPFDKLPEDFPWSDLPLDKMPEDFDWNNIPWESLPEDFPWGDIPFDEMPEDFDWNSIPWENLPEDFPWGDIPFDKMPEDFDWNIVPWDKLPEDFDWNSVPWDKMPGDFDWNGLPWEQLPDDFPWQDIPAGDLPDDFDWNNMPWGDLPDDFDWNSVPWESMPDDFDWNNFPFEDLPEDFPWDRIPWHNMPEDFDWSRIPWENMPENFPWESIPWQDMPEDFWESFPWTELPEGFPWYVLPWLLINPDLVPEGVFPDDFYPPEWDCEHEYSTDWVVTKPPTCVEAGEQYNLCTKCKRIISEAIPPTGKHEFGSDFICGMCGIRKIIVRSDSHTKEYDGEPISMESARLIAEQSASLLSGHSINFAGISYVSGSELKKIPNSFAFTGAVVVDGEGNDVSALYYLVREFGTLEIKTRRATLKTHDRTKPYDGTLLTGQKEDAYIENLAKGDYLDLESLVFGDGIKEMGRTENRVTAFVIRNANGEDVTDRYSIETSFGQLVITRAASPAPSAILLAGEQLKAVKYAYFAKRDTL